MDAVASQAFRYRVTGPLRTALNIILSRYPCSRQLSQRDFANGLIYSQLLSGPSGASLPRDSKCQLHGLSDPMANHIVPDPGHDTQEPPEQMLRLLDGAI